jgi:hypothetical protein
MATSTTKRRWSFVKEWRSIRLARSSNSLEAVAKQMNDQPETIAKITKRIGLPLKSTAKVK